MRLDRDTAPYSACFCEENIWQLAGQLKRQESLSAESDVLIFFNDGDYIAMLNQRAFDPGAIGFWDYHVVLFDGSNRLVFDLDTRLNYPAPVGTYFRETFPSQAELPDESKTLVRRIPVDEYLNRFASDRSHMLDENGIPRAPFPKWPIIISDHPIWLAQYLELGELAESDSFVVTVEEFL